MERTLIFTLFWFVRFQIYLGASVLRALQFPFLVLRALQQHTVRLVRSRTVAKIIVHLYLALYTLGVWLHTTCSVFFKRAVREMILAPRHVVSGSIAFIRGAHRFAVRLYHFFLSPSFGYFVGGSLATFGLIAVIELFAFIRTLPSPAALGKVNFATSSHLYDASGKLLYEIYRDVNRTPVALDNVPQYVIDATIAIEDRNFYHHQGISFIGGIVRAARDSIIYNELQGGSTLTQQLVKSALLTPERTIERKLKEIVLAIWTEQLYTKNEIMEMYLNQVPYGGSSYGIEEASKVYFGKSVTQLTLGESALLAGLPKAPSIYSPFIDRDLAKKRRDQVLGEMFRHEFISEEQYLAGLKEELRVQPPTTNIRAPHFVMYTKTLLEGEYGSSQVEQAGFQVQTSLNLDIQKFVETTLKEELEKLAPLRATNGAVVVMDPRTGAILAMVGSVDYFQEEFGAFNVAVAPRQPGSTLKPMLYAMAIGNGFTAASIIDDAPIVFQIPGGEPYRPVNYDRRFHGKVPIRYALANSYNIPAVKVLNVLGVDNFVSFAKQMGIDTWGDSSRFGLSLSLGGGEVTLMDLVQVYAVFANGGYRVEPNPVQSIMTHAGETIYSARTDKYKVLDEGVAYIISDILSDTIARQSAFGANNPLEVRGYQVSAKTGTTNDYKDAWTIGFTDKAVVGVWVGNNNNTPMHQIAGSLGAGPIFNRVMRYLIEEHDAKNTREVPENVIGIPCYGGRIEYFIRGTEAGACVRTIIKPSGAQPQESGTEGVQEVRNPPTTN